MPIIKNIGKQQRMVVDRYLMPGDARYISPKRVSGFQGDPDFEIVDETPKSSDQMSTILKVQVEIVDPAMQAVVDSQGMWADRDDLEDIADRSDRIEELYGSSLDTPVSATKAPSTRPAAKAKRSKKK